MHPRIERLRQRVTRSHGTCLSPDRGFALLIVLWALILLSLLTLRLTAGGYVATTIAGNQRGSAVAEAAADGGIFLGIFRLLDPSRGRWAPDGAPHLVRVGETLTEVRIYDEGGKVDPNFATVPLLAALLRACGAQPPVGAQLAASIFNWRSPPIAALPDGAHFEQYRAAGMRFAPANARFASVEEVALVFGMTRELFACLRPRLSVHTSAMPLPRLADPVVARALAEIYPDAAAQAALEANYRPAVVRVTATASSARGARFRREAIVRLRPRGTSTEPEDAGFTFRIVNWDGGTS
jgi:general secretion pathway protein K